MLPAEGTGVACHGSNQNGIKGGLHILTLPSTLSGGDSVVPGFIAGKPNENSALFAVTRWQAVWTAMPLPETGKPCAEQIGWIRKGWPAVRVATHLASTGDRGSAQTGEINPPLQRRTMGGRGQPAFSQLQKRNKVEASPAAV
jgi:hypothetical protein